MVIKVTVDAKKVINGLNKFPREMLAALDQAGRKSADKVILPTVGLKSYPPESAGNRSPYPYYVRGRGTQYSPSFNDMKSVRLGTQFYVAVNRTRTTIGNRASYAPHVIGELQGAVMGYIGWRKLFDVAKEKLAEISKVYAEWIDYAIRKAGLKP